jgi:hypothetical protein
MRDIKCLAARRLEQGDILIAPLGREDFLVREILDTDRYKVRCVGESQLDGTREEFTFRAGKPLDISRGVQ